MKDLKELFWNLDYYVEDDLIVIKPDQIKELEDAKLIKFNQDDCAVLTIPDTGKVLKAYRVFVDIYKEQGYPAGYYCILCMYDYEEFDIPQDFEEIDLVRETIEFVDKHGKETRISFLYIQG